MYDCKAEKIFRKINYVLCSIGGVLLVIMMALLVINIITRRFFNAPIIGIVELSGYISLIMCAISLGHLEWVEGSLVMTLLTDRLKPKSFAFFKFLSSIICCVGFSVAGYYLCREAIRKASEGQISMTLHIPLGLIIGILACGFIWMVICLGVKAVLFYMSFRAGGVEPKFPDLI